MLGWDANKRLPEFYQHAINVVYAVVIGLSFDISRMVVIPFENIPLHIINTLILLLAYFIVITSWIGYFLSIKKEPHKGVLGIGRFAIDLFIIYLFYYLVSLSDPRNSKHLSDVFIYILPLIYGVYLLWDIVKHFEYKTKNLSSVEKTKRSRWIQISIDYLIIFIVLSVFYYIFGMYGKNVMLYFGSGIHNYAFVIVSFIFTGMYRRAKWKEIHTRHAKTIKKRRFQNDAGNA